MNAVWPILKGTGLFLSAGVAAWAAFTAGSLAAPPKQIKEIPGAAIEALFPHKLAVGLIGLIDVGVVTVWALGISSGWLALGASAFAGFLLGWGGERACWSRMTPEAIAAWLDEFKERQERDNQRIITAQLRSASAATRAETASRAGELGSRFAVLPLVSVLETDSDPDVRQAAARALGSLGDARAVPALVARLDDDSLNVVKAAAKSLQALGWAPVEVRDQLRLGLVLDDEKALADLAPRTVDELLEVLGNETRRFRAAAARALGASGDGRAVPALTKALDDPVAGKEAAAGLVRLGWAPSTLQESLRHATAGRDVTALARLGQAAVPVLGRLARERERDAALALGRIGGAQATGALQELLGHVGEVREAAVDALINSSDPAASSILITAMANGPLKHHRAATAEKMAGCGGPARDALVAALEGRDADLGAAAARALAGVGWGPPLPDARLAFFVKAGRWDDVVALGALAAGPVQSAAANPAPFLRRIVLESVGRKGGEWARGILVSALKDRVYAVRKVAATGLRTLGLDGSEGAEMDVKPTPGECAFCASRLENVPTHVGLSMDAIGRTVATREPQAADVLLRAACACECGLPGCYACFTTGKQECPDCGAQTGPGPGRL